MGLQSKVSAVHKLHHDVRQVALEGFGAGTILAGGMEEITDFRLKCLSSCHVLRSPIGDGRMNRLLTYDLGPGVEAFFSARREGTACGRIINAIKLL